MSWRQQGAEPLFPEIVWGVPQRQEQTASVLLVGGNRESIKVLLATHAALMPIFRRVTIALPDIFQKQLKNMDNLMFCPSNQSGSLSGKGLQALGQACAEHDCLLLAGDFTHNSQTTLLVDQLLKQTSLPTIASGDIAGWILSQPAHYSQKLVLVVEPEQLQHYLGTTKASKLYKPDMSIHLFAELLGSLPSSLQLISWHANHLWAWANKTAVSSSRDDFQLNGQQQLASLSARLTLYLSQNPKQPLAALASAIYAEN